VTVDDKANGGAGATPVTEDVLILTYDRVRDHLEVGGKCNSLDIMLDMLSRAKRVLENKWKVERAKELRQQLADEARTAAILNSVAGRG
jgi:hypothetical protein